MRVFRMDEKASGRVGIPRAPPGVSAQAGIGGRMKAFIPTRPGMNSTKYQGVDSHAYIVSPPGRLYVD